MGLFDEIRKLFAELPESKVRGYKPGRFSFNVHGGRCEACQTTAASRMKTTMPRRVQSMCTPARSFFWIGE